MLYTYSMRYNLKGTDLQITPEIREYVEKRLASLDKFVGDLGAARADVELEYSALWDGPKYRAEMAYHEPAHAPLRAEARGAQLHEAIDLAAAELFREMTRVKKKRLHLLRRGAARFKDFVRGFRNRF